MTTDAEGAAVLAGPQAAGAAVGAGLAGPAQRADGPPRTAKERLLAVLAQRSLTALEALQECKLMTLAQRVSEFRRAGVLLHQDVLETDGGKHVARYWLAEPLEAALAKWRVRSAVAREVGCAGCD